MPFSVRKLLTIVLIVNSFFLSSCDQGETQNEHVWKEQTDAIDKAKAVEDILQDSSDELQRRIQNDTE